MILMPGFMEATTDCMRTESAGSHGFYAVLQAYMAKNCNNRRQSIMAKDSGGVQRSMQSAHTPVDPRTAYQRCHELFIV